MRYDWTQATSLEAGLKTSPLKRSSSRNAKKICHFAWQQVVTTLLVVITVQCIQISNHHLVHLKPIECSMSITPQKKKSPGSKSGVESIYKLGSAYSTLIYLNSSQSIVTTIYWVNSPVNLFTHQTFGEHPLSAELCSRGWAHRQVAIFASRRPSIQVAKTGSTDWRRRSLSRAAAQPPNARCSRLEP